MAIASVTSQQDFLREFIMARTKFDPPEFGVNLSKEEFVDLMVGEFNSYTRSAMTIDELCLRPREALAFCDQVRRTHGWFDLPDDIILRVIMTRRKNPGG